MTFWATHLGPEDPLMLQVDILELLGASVGEADGHGVVGLLSCQLALAPGGDLVELRSHGINWDRREIMAVISIIQI
jgi:hypothetical protein